LSTYCTIQSTSEGIFKEKGSKFISLAFPVSTESGTQRVLDEVKAKYYDARHHCYAWILGMDEQNWKANDDGEPSHSAGDPILGQIRSFELTNTMVVVVRYFGGTKLGVGGLINAYKTAARVALEIAPKTSIFETTNISFVFSYDDTSIVEKLISDFEIDVLERKFTEQCEIIGEIKKDKIDLFQIRTKDLYMIDITLGK